MIRPTIVLALLTVTALAHADGSISGWVKPMGYIETMHPVQITVLDPLTGEAIPGLSTVNSEDGTYEISGIPEGDYKVLYDAIDDASRHIDELSGNVPCDNGDCDRAALGKVVHIGEGNTTLNITLVNGMWLSGKVTDAARKPLPGVTVEFYNVDGSPYCCKRVTDENGVYSKPVFWPRGYYAVARFAEPSSYQPQIYRDQPCSGCDVEAKGVEIYVEYGGRSGIDFRLPKVTADPAIQRQAVDAYKYSGSWYSPDRPGEGFIVQVLKQTAAEESEEETAVVFWFTFTSDGKQAWMVGSGPINGGVAEVSFEITDGASFGMDFDPQQVGRKNWGSLRLDFLNCNDAHAEYAGNFGSGQLDLTRLTAIQGLDCAAADDKVVSGSAAVSGAWFNPARDGQGFIVETVDDSSVLAYWFTYDTNGQQMWMLGVGDISDDGEQVHIPMQRASGGRFGDAFDPEQVVLENWGEVNFRFDACNHASYSWEAQPPFGSGGFELTRLTALQNIACWVDAGGSTQQ